MERMTVPRLFFYSDAHAARRAGDHAHGRFQAGGIQVGHLGLRDLLNVGLADAGNLVLVGNIRVIELSVGKTGKRYGIRKEKFGNYMISGKTAWRLVICQPFIRISLNSYRTNGPYGQLRQKF